MVKFAKKAKRYISFLLIIVTMMSSMQLAFAGKDGEESGELTDEEWEEIKDEFTDLDNLSEDDDWDHVTWDSEHKEIVWVVFAGTEWTDGSFPNLNFSEFGSALYETAYLTEEEKASIGDYIRNYRWYTGMFSKKDATTNTVDNSAYVPLVICCMDTLKSKGYGDDPFAIQTYVTDANKLHSYYTTWNSNYLQSVSLLIYKRLVTAEKHYNSTHKPENANIYKAYDGSEGLYMMTQEVVYDNFAKTKNGYSESVASNWFDDVNRGNLGYSKFDNFASFVMAKYKPTETKNKYIMDAFGKKLEYSD